MKHLWGVLLFSVLAACSSTPAGTASTATVDVVPTVTPTAPLPSTTLPSTVTPTVKPDPITPEIKLVSPEIREVELSELGLSNSTRLVLYYQPSDSLRIMSGQDIKPQRIPNIQSEAYIWSASNIDISPNQKWFIYPVFKKMQKGIAFYDFWLSSIDGKEQKIAASDIQGTTRPRWVTNEYIELWYYFGGASTCPKRESIVNPFTQEILIPPEVPPSISPQCFFDLSINPERSKIIYINQKDWLWKIYDFNTGQNQSVFPWLSQSDRFALWPRYIRWSANGITIVLPREESIDFLIDLPISDVSNSNVAFSRDLLPNGKKIYSKDFSWWALDKGLVGFDLVRSDYDYSGNLEGSLPSNFMILDFKHSALYDYNLDRAKTGNMQKVFSPFIFSSADNRFLAWTIYAPPGQGTALETVVLDKETGRIARIKGFEFYGWGEVDQP